ncbi:hypothetical protein YC2023_088665 [Brassica napus]
MLSIPTMSHRDNDSGGEGDEGGEHVPHQGVVIEEINEEVNEGDNAADGQQPGAAAEIEDPEQEEYERNIRQMEEEADDEQLWSGEGMQTRLSRDVNRYEMYNPLLPAGQHFPVEMAEDVGLKRKAWLTSDNGKSASFFKGESSGTSGAKRKKGSVADQKEQSESSLSLLSLISLNFRKTLILIGAVQPVADSGESVTVVTGCLPLNLFCLFPFSVSPPFSALCLTDIPSVVVSLSSLASLLGGLGSGAVVRCVCKGGAWWFFRGLTSRYRSDLARSAFNGGRLCFGGGAPVILDSSGVCSGSQCLSLVRVIVVLGCCSLPSSSFPVTASVASISAVRVLVLWFLPCGVSSFYRAGREEQRWLFVVIGVWGFDRLWFVDFAALVRPHCRLLRAPSSRWCLCSLQVEGLRGEVMFWRRVPGQANITGS